MSAALCLGCGQEIWRNRNGDWESRETGIVCPGGGPHWVRQIIPDPGAGRP